MTRSLPATPQRSGARCRIALALATVFSMLGAVIPSAAAVAETNGTILEMQEPEWAHETVTDGAAVAWVEQDVSVEAGGMLRIRGTGWTDLSGSTGSTVAIKLGSGPLAQYSRSGEDVVSHPSAGGESTIWALLAPENPTGHAQVHPVDEAGNFDIAIDLPDDLVPGQEFTVRFQSGLFAIGDTQRTLSTAPLVVGGVPFIGGGEEELPTCVPSTAEPTVSVAETSMLGGVLSVTGTGWCHPGEASGGSRIAIKIDEGRYKHLTGDIHSNRTIWAIVDADHETGDWSAEIQLPDGTEATSSPAFEEGSHTLRLLTGSLKDDDASRTVRSEPFVVGEYSPGALPEPLDIDGGALIETNRNGISLEQRATPAPGRWLVTVPNAQKGDWVYIDVYVGSSSRAPFPRWSRLDAEKRAVLSLAGVELAQGDVKVTVQNGNRGQVGELLGWTEARVEAQKTGRPIVRPPAKAPAPITGARVSAASSSAPVAVPAPPVKRGSQLTKANAGRITSMIEGGVVTLTVADGEPNQWIYAYIYTGAQNRPIGWVQLDDRRQMRVDVSEMPDGNHKIALVGVDGKLIGWTSAAKGRVVAADLETGRSDGTPTQAEGPRALKASALGNVPNWLPDLMIGSGAVLLLGGAVAAALTIRNRRNA